MDVAFLVFSARAAGILTGPGRDGRGHRLCPSLCLHLMLLCLCHPFLHHGVPCLNHDNVHCCCWRMDGAG